jgi:hypothetical protein
VGSGRRAGLERAAWRSGAGRESVAAGLNAKLTAERLHLHVNTGHYRLTRIAERTGCDLRRVDDVVELLLAARIAGAEPSRRSTDCVAPRRWAQAHARPRAR